MVAVGALLMLITAYGLAALAPMTAALIITLGWLGMLPLLATALGGGLVLYRDTLAARGQRDLFLSLVEKRTEAALSAGADGGLRLRRGLRALLPTRQLLVGEWVQIAAWEQIRATLDDQGCLDRLPFQPEMLKYCGQRAQVFRRVDKIYDYGGKKNLRRLRDTVLLRHLRCDGAEHAGCEAGCYLMWKEAWLQPGAKLETSANSTAVQFPRQLHTADAGSIRYTCQFTQLVAASTELKDWDLRQDLRPLLAGNLTLRAFLVAILTRLFNAVQAWRGGVGFPSIPASSLTSTPVVSLGLVEGNEIRVRSIIEISRTLDARGKNRGLWFDRDMVKHCGQRYQVLKRVERIIDDANGQMRFMKTPCIVLERVSYSGEGLRFCAQQDSTFWREAWLLPIAKAVGTSGAVPVGKTNSAAAVRASHS